MKPLDINHTNINKQLKLLNGGKLMKNFKRTLAAILTAATMLTPCIAATTMNVSAAGNITFTNPAEGHTYTAYQVFSGSISGTNIGNAAWGSDVNGDALLAALKGSTLTEFEDVTTVQDVVTVLCSSGFDTSELDIFAGIVQENLKTGVTGTTASGNVISNAADGYYLIVDSGKSGEPTARYMLEVSGEDVDVNSKTSAFPTLDKTFADGETSNTASIGDTINYKLTSTVPDMTGYNKYFFIVNDTLDTGLTLKADSFVVKVGGTTLTVGDDYYVEVDGQSFKLVFKNFIKHTAGQAIEITYSATLNENADLGTGANDGNENTANLTYSNNPNFEYKGDDNGTPDDTTDDNPDEPGSTGKTDNPDTPGVDESKEPTGDTPDEVVVTYSTKLQIDKVDEKNAPLPGAGFTLYKGNAVDEANKVKEFTAVSATQFELEGLGAGTYTLAETTTPGGYNTIAPITFTISATSDLDSVTWTADKTFTFNDGTAEFEATIQNNKGSQLPETGGIGTTIFYIVGGLLVVGSSVVLITKKRMSAEK